MSIDDGVIATLNSKAEPVAATAASPGEFNIQVSLNGVPLGWLTNGGGPEYWIVAVPNRSEGTTWTQISTSDEGIYLKKSTNNYLSYRSNHVVFQDGLKMRDWATAAKWKLEGKHLRCLDNDQLVGRDGDSFYCNGKNVVDVEFSPV